MNGAVILLAAGYSRRLGTNKSFIKYNGEFLIDLAIKKLLNLGLEFVVIANENNYSYIQNNYKNINIVLNDNNKGQNTSIALGVRYFKDKDYLMFMPIDQPFLSENSIKNIITHFKKDFIIMPKFAGKNALPTIFSSRYFDELLEISGDRGGKDIARKYSKFIKIVNLPNAIEGLDIDTADDLELLRRDYG